MAVLKIASVGRCKLCKHPKRDEIDAWLEKRSNGEVVDGNRVNLEYALARLAELGVENPTEDNVKNHWKKHCEKVADDALAEQAQREAEVEAELKNEALAVMERILGKDWREKGLTPTPEQIGELHRARAVRRDRSPHAMERWHGLGGDEGRARAGGRQHRRHQAVGVHVHERARLHAARRTGGIPRRRGERRLKERQQQLPRQSVRLPAATLVPGR